MRGPFDDVVEAGQAPAEAELAAGEEEAPRRRPPGGKALIRLLQLLDAAGHTETGVATVEAAVAPEERDDFQERSAQFTAAPEAKASAAAEAGKRRARPKKGTKKGGAASAAAESALEVAQAYIDAADRLAPPSGTGPQWRSLGPWTIPNGQTYGASRVNVSGRVAALAIHPTNPARILCGAANGGVWETFNRGASWAPRTDYQATLTVGALAYDPSDPSTVYCGTGEGNWWWFLGAGVLRSSDGGTSWTSLATAPFVGQGFYDLIVDPEDGRRLVAATTGGIYVSTDSGVTWTRRRSVRCWSLSMSPPGSGPSEILAACADGVFRSGNRGNTWNAETLPGVPGFWSRLAVAIAPSNPGVAYAWGANGGSAYLRRRAGGTWATVSPPPGVSTGQAWYDWFLAVAPDRDTQIYCGAIEVHRGDLSGTTWAWVNLTSKGATGDSIHPDQHAITFDPASPDRIYVGNDGGLYRSDDRGIHWQSCNNGLVISEFEYLAQDQGSSRYILGGTQDNGTERWLGSPTWEHVQDGDGGDCGVNRTNPATVFHTFFGMSPERSTTSGGFGTWGWIGPPVPSGEGSLFYPPFECSATGGDTIAIGGDSLFVSRNNGTSWVRLAFPSAGRSTALAIPNPNAVYVGTGNGGIFRTTWNGVSWSALTALGTPRPGASISDLYVDPSNISRIWATSTRIGGGRVFRSDNGGTSWLDRTALLPNLPINAIEVDNFNANRIWVAADLGVYQSFDGGGSWNDFSNGLPNMFVGDLIFHQHARVLRAGTRNRGVWEIPVDGWMTQPICGVQWIGSLAGGQQLRWFTYNWPATWHVVWTVMPVTVQTGTPEVSWTVAVERASAEYVTYWITVTNLTPSPLTFEGRYCILSRY